MSIKWLSRNDVKAFELRHVTYDILVHTVALVQRNGLRNASGACVIVNIVSATYATTLYK